MAEELSPEELLEEKKVADFRELSQKIKKIVMERNVYASQNPAVLNEIQEFFASDVYGILLPIIRGKADLSTLKNKEFEALFAEILSPPCSEFLRRRLEYYLHRDFVMFPFTMDPQTINSQNDSSSYETAINFVSRN